MILNCAYDWAVDDSHSRPYIRLEFEQPMVLEQVIGGVLAFNEETEEQPELPCAWRRAAPHRPRTLWRAWASHESCVTD